MVHEPVQVTALHDLGAIQILFTEISGDWAAYCVNGIVFLLHAGEFFHSFVPIFVPVFVPIFFPIFDSSLFKYLLFVCSNICFLFVPMPVVHFSHCHSMKYLPNIILVT